MTQKIPFKIASFLDIDKSDIVTKFAMVATRKELIMKGKSHFIIFPKSLNHFLEGYFYGNFILTYNVICLFPTRLNKNLFYRGFLFQFAVGPV